MAGDELFISAPECHKHRTKMDEADACAAQVVAIWFDGTVYIGLVRAEPWGRWDLRHPGGPSASCTAHDR